MLFLHSEDTLREAIIASRTAGSDTLWSNDNLYKHLSFLASSFTNKVCLSLPHVQRCSVVANGGSQNETSSRIVIDTFFFRATAMVPLPQKVIVMLENQVSVIHPRLSQMDTIIDYTAIVTESSIAGAFFTIFLCLRIV